MQTSVKFWSVVAIGMAVLAVPLRAESLYLANEDGSSISACRIEGNGRLKPVTGSPFPSWKSPVSIAVDLPSHLLYANIYDGTVSTYRIDSNGALTHLGDSSAGTMPVSVVVDPFGRFLYVADMDGNGTPGFEGSTVGHVSVVGSGRVSRNWNR